jgi:hypothetical protein
MRVKYNEHGDVMYVSIRDTKMPCVYVEEETGIVCRLEATTRSVVGVTIPFFMQRVGRSEQIRVKCLDTDLSGQTLLSLIGHSHA